MKYISVNNREKRKMLVRSSLSTLDRFDEAKETSHAAVPLRRKSPLEKNVWKSLPRLPTSYFYAGWVKRMGHIAAQRVLNDL